MYPNPALSFDDLLLFSNDGNENQHLARTRNFSAIASSLSPSSGWGEPQAKRQRQMEVDYAPNGFANPGGSFQPFPELSVSDNGDNFLNSPSSTFLHSAKNVTSHEVEEMLEGKSPSSIKVETVQPEQLQQTRAEVQPNGQIVMNPQTVQQISLSNPPLSAASLLQFSQLNRPPTAPLTKESNPSTAATCQGLDFAAHIFPRNSPAKHPPTHMKHS